MNEMQRKLEVGLDCVSSVTWRNWETGREYRKSLSVKNISREVQTLHWQPPDSPNFSTEYHGPIRLNPGVTALIGLIFKPSKFVDYESTLRCVALKGSFLITLKGITSSKPVQCPPSLSFEGCIVNGITNKQFRLSNIGDKAISYEWIVQPPFFISPQVGFLLPGDCASASCSFMPRKACPYSVEAFCITAAGETSQMSLSGIGKYTFLRLDPSVLDFGDVVVGSARELVFTITNTSQVAATIFIRIIEDCLHPLLGVFSVDPVESSIQSNENLSVKVMYTPLSAGTFSVGQIEVRSFVQCVTSLTCTGYALRPLVIISNYSLDFGSLPCGSTSYRSLSLQNVSKVHVSFQFMVSSFEVFHVQTDRGVIKPGCKILIRIAFRPGYAANYYKRVVCIVQDQHPLYCDLVGTCFIDKVDFPTLKMHHVVNHREHMRDIARSLRMTDSKCKNGCEANDAGIVNVLSANRSPVKASVRQNETTKESNWEEVRHASHASSSKVHVLEMQTPFELCASMSEVSSHEHHLTTQSQLFSHEMDIFNKISKQLCTADEVWDEYFLGRILHWEPVKVEPTTLEFGVVPHLQKSEEKYVNVKNNSNNTIFCCWHTSEIPWRDDATSYYNLDTMPIVPSRGPWTKKKQEENFMVSPQTVTLLPNATITFAATFAPDKENQYYLKNLNLYISHDSKEASHVSPPWCTSIQVSGSSFCSKEQEFLPHAYFFPSTVSFAPILQGESVYQTIALRNQGCTPVRFAFKTDTLNPAFMVKPSEGIVAERSFQLISFRFNSSTPCSYVERLSCVLNNSLIEELALTLIASSHVPQVEVEGSNSIRFKCTNVGVPVAWSITISNLSNVSALFDWKVPTAFATIFSVNPSSGIIMGKQKVRLSCSFCPVSPGYCKLSVPCAIISLVEKAIYNRQGVTVNVVPVSEIGKLYAVFEGEGKRGFVKLAPQQLDLGPLTVGFPHKCKLTIYNLSEGSLNYTMDFSSLKGTNKDDYILKFDNSQGQIPSFSHRDVLVTFKPKCASTFCIQAVCNVSVSHFDEEKPDKSGEACHCILSGQAMFPSLAIFGARGEGFSNAQMWRQLHLNELDLLLAEAEVKKDIGLSGSQDFFGLGAPVEHTSPFIFYFGHRNVATKPTAFELILTTRGRLPVSWRIRLWNDKEVDEENWMEEPEPSDEECLYMAIRDQALIQVCPSEGHLSPQESVHIKFTYRHNVEGVHVLPGILQIEKGQSLPLRFSGETLPRGIRILTLEARTFVLKPMVVGDVNPPLQTFELRNDGISKLKYSLDLTPLEGLQKDSYGFKVLMCLNPLGYIPPNETLLLNWLFQPIEVKKYAVDLLISVEHGEAVMLSIEGTGIENVLQAGTQGRDASLKEEPCLSHPEPGRWMGLPAMLTTEYLNYKNIVTQTSLGKLVGVTNLGRDSEVHFSWHCSFATNRCIYGHFSVIPSQGVIEPGRSSICKITLTAGMQPQMFETTLYCLVQEIAEKNLAVKDTDLSEYSEEVLAEDWNQLESYTYNTERVSECAVTKLTESIKQRLPSLARKRHLQFPSIIKPAVDTREKGRQSGVLYLTVAATIQSVERFGGPSQDREPSTCCSEDKDYDGSLKGEVEEQLLTEMLQEAIQEVWLESGQLSNKEVVFFEQYAKLQASPAATHWRSGKSMHCDDQSTGEGGCCKVNEQKKFEYVDAFEVAKMMLDFMLFDLLKDLHDSHPSLSM